MLKTTNYVTAEIFTGDYIVFKWTRIENRRYKMTMLAERQLNYLLEIQKLNDILPPFVNRKVRVG
jgi:histidine ammonia-lyase